MATLLLSLTVAGAAVLLKLQHVLALHAAWLVLEARQHGHATAWRLQALLHKRLVPRVLWLLLLLLAQSVHADWMC